MICISETDVAAARANVSVYARHVRLKRSGDWLIGKCPFHDDATPSFAVRDGKWWCFAGCPAEFGHDVIGFLRKLRRLDFETTVREILGAQRSLRVGIGRSSRSIGHQDCDRAAAGEPGDAGAKPARLRDIRYITDLWGQATDPGLVELYLYSRGINLRPKPLPWALRGHKRVWCTETCQERPCVLAAVSGESGGITALQRIWVADVLLTDSGISPAKGTRAIDLVAAKKTLGSLHTGAVRLAEAGPILGLAEGVETALSAAQLYRCPVWATLGASRLGSIELPEIVTRVIIFGDNGSAGEKAAAAAVSAYCRRGYRADAAFPEPIFLDFNDQLSRRADG